MDCGAGNYHRLMQKYPLVTDVFLALDEKYQQVRPRMRLSLLAFVSATAARCLWPLFRVVGCGF
jgi:hypothetical protein